MDSEDEWAEENGEDIDKKDAENEEDEEMNDEEQEQEEGFIVSDGHLSVCEYDFSQDEEDENKKLEEIQQRRERLKNQKDLLTNRNSDTVYIITQDSEGSEIF